MSADQCRIADSTPYCRPRLPHAPSPDAHASGSARAWLCLAAALTAHSPRGRTMRNSLFGFLALLCVAMPVSAQATPTVDEIIARYVKTVGGVDRIAAAKTLRRTGKYTGSGGFEADVVQENKRPALVREEFTLQGMTAVNAFDGKTGWKIDPFAGKKDAEALSEDE